MHEAADPAGEAAWIAEAIDGLLGGSSFHSLDSGRADGHGHGGIGLADIAVLYRTDAQAVPLGQGADPGRAAVPEALARPAGAPARGGGDPPGAGPGRATRTRPGTAPPGRGRAPAAAHGEPARRRRGRGPGSGAGRGGLSGPDLRTAGEVLAPLARRCGDDMEQFRTEIALGAEVDALDPRADAIALLTLHAAKGLEFEVVFLAGCERDLLPLWLPGAAPEARPDPAEERRLLFVGMTRARTHLLLSCAARRSRHGSSAETGVSPFLSAIDPGLLDRSGPPRPAARRPPAPAALSRGGRCRRRPAARWARGSAGPGGAPGGRRMAGASDSGVPGGAGPGSGASGSDGSRSSIRLLPSVLGLTRPRSRNSATPSS